MAVDVQVDNVEPQSMSRETDRVPQILLAQQNATIRRNAQGGIEHGALPAGS
jgi:hypothetical protein